MRSTTTLRSFVRECPGDLVTPVSAFLRLQPLGARFLLESVEGGERSSRYSFVGLGARARIWADADGTWCAEPEAEPRRLAPPAADPLDVAVQYARQFRCQPDPRIPRFLGGLVGYVGYDYARRLERLGTPPPGDTLPEIMFDFVDTLLVFDHLLHRLYLAALSEESSPRAAQVLERFAAALSYAHPLPHGRGSASGRPRFRSLMSDDHYRSAVCKLQDHIRAGDIFQAVLSREVEVLDPPPMFEVYRALRRISPSSYMFYQDFGDVCLTGSSPESAVQLTHRRAALRPIAGTRPRGADEAEDVRLELELLASPKERAEHAMLVDLARNDLSRVAVPGTVKVRDLARVERFSHVMHLVSDVEAELDPERSEADLIRATFPAGTVSGAPKIRAMQLIDECETTRRDLYAGCMGYIGLDGTLDMALTIRSAFYAGGRTTIRAGAGVVAGSTPDGELAECRAKLAALMAAFDSAAHGHALDTTVRGVDAGHSAEPKALGASA